MTQAYICDAIRTPIGRYGGALSSVRADDLGAVPLQGTAGAVNPQVDWSSVDDIDLRLRQPGRRRQPQRGAHVGAVGRVAGQCARHHRQSPVRFRAWMRSARRRAPFAVARPG